MPNKEKKGFIAFRIQDVELVELVDAERNRYRIWNEKNGINITNSDFFRMLFLKGWETYCLEQLPQEAATLSSH